MREGFRERTGRREATERVRDTEQRERRLKTARLFKKESRRERKVSSNSNSLQNPINLSFLSSSCDVFFLRAKYMLIISESE